MRAYTVAVLIALAGLAGCLQAGEPIDTNDAPPEPTGDPDDPAPNPNASTDESGANETSASPEGNGTDPADETDGTDANGTSDASPEPARLPANLSMASAEVIERTSEQVRFRWQASAEPDGNTSLAARTTFDVPAGVPLTINATLTWTNASDLDLYVDGEHVERYCSSVTPADPGLEGGEEACSVRTFARSTWDTWGVRVDGNKLGRDAPPRPTNFTVELHLAVAEPWTGPPVEAPEPAADVRSDPGWPAIADAAIRPGVKVGTSVSGVNSGTGNFVFSSPDNRTLYLGWIAHGVDGMEPGDTIALPTVGVEATLVYCSWGIIEETVTCPSLDSNLHPRGFNDFALLELPAQVRSLVHPATPVWGGPTELGTQPTRGDSLSAIGNTPLRDGGREGVEVLDPMRGLVMIAKDQATEAHLAPQPVPGDSGGPVQRASGEAIGTLSSIGYRGEALSGTTIIADLANALDVMENETALDVELKRWPTFDTPRAQDLADPPASPEPLTPRRS